MKKLIGTAMLAALLATSAFAELSISGGATQLWSPIAYNGDDVMTGSQNPWGGARTGSVGFTWVSEDGKAGTSLAFVYNPWNPDHDKDDAGIASDGSRVIWLKPWDFLKLTLGHWDGINDISPVNTASWDWARPNNWIDPLYAENEYTGAMIEITPIESLMVRVGLPFANPGIAYQMFEAVAADVEYTIEDILGIKVGWRGGRADHNTMTPSIYKYDGDFLNVGEVNVFLSLLAVENLQLDLGARINILSSDYGKGTYREKKADETFYEYGKALSGRSAIIGLKAGYNITDNFSVKADFAVATYKDFKYEDFKGEHKPDFAFGVGIGYGLTDSLELVADFRGMINGDVKDDTATYSADPTFSFLVGLNYTCSTNASVGIGFQGKTNGGDIGPLSARSDNFGFAVPIRASVSF